MIRLARCRKSAVAPSIILAAVVAAAACDNIDRPEDLLVMKLQMHERSPWLMAFGQEGSELLAGVDLSEARAALQICGTTLSQWERLPPRSDPDLGLTHYWRCLANDVTVIAEVYWGGALGRQGHIGTDGVRFAACLPSRCPAEPSGAFER